MFYYICNLYFSSVSTGLWLRDEWICSRKVLPASTYALSWYGFVISCVLFMIKLRCRCIPISSSFVQKTNVLLEDTYLNIWMIILSSDFFAWLNRFWQTIMWSIFKKCSFYCVRTKNHMILYLLRIPKCTCSFLSTVLSP